MDERMDLCRCNHHRMSHRSAGVDPQRFPARCDGMYDRAVPLCCDCTEFVKLDAETEAAYRLIESMMR
jgi:hypothetical protein